MHAWPAPSANDGSSAQVGASCVRASTASKATSRTRLRLIVIAILGPCASRRGGRVELPAHDLRYGTGVEVGRAGVRGGWAQLWQRRGACIPRTPPRAPRIRPGAPGSRAPRAGRRRRWWRAEHCSRPRPPMRHRQRAMVAEHAGRLGVGVAGGAHVLSEARGPRHDQGPRSALTGRRPHALQPV